jgi:hypothetical protein
MAKTLLTLAAGAALFAFTLPGPADAAERRADGLRNNIEQTEFSSGHRRWHRKRVVVRRYHYPHYGYYGHPYAYGWGYPYYYRPRPFIGFGVGPFGFGVW